MTGAVESSPARLLQRLLPPAGDGMPATSGRPDRIFHLDVDFSHDGTWSGIRHLVASAYLELLEHGHADLLERHAYELHRVLPEFRDRIVLKHACLTDTAHGSERTRNFPLDRAYRLVHGLVGLLLQWKRLLGAGQRWIVVIENFEQAQHLGTRFVAELARRSARAFDVLIDTLLDAAAIASRTPGVRSVSTDMTIASLGLMPLMPPTLSDEERDAIERRLQGNDILDWEDHYPALLAYYAVRMDTLECAKIAIRALCICNHYGYYHESASFADTVLPHFNVIVDDNEESLWNYIGNIFQGLVTTGAEDRALELILALAEPRLTRPDMRARMHYLLSMSYLRYNKSPDLANAEEHIMKASAAIQAAQGQIDPSDYAFLKVFIDNGVAFLRVRQGRQAEALSLCQEGYAFLTRELGEDRHMLHRSVLQYNTAQVYVMLNHAEEAIKHYRKSIEMDPYYSEYYNEVGNILQRLDRFEEANSMYALAIEYSAPYPEVNYNKGLCHVGLGMHDEALACFEYSLELNPAQPDIHMVRAELYEAGGCVADALTDYDAAIALSPDAIPARVNRAVLHFNDGRYDLALTDMNHVIAIDSSEPSHYLNRAEIHKAMAQRELYQRDLATAEAFEAAA
jgi:tetratricopeptide (TPR) repeat protein